MSDAYCRKCLVISDATRAAKIGDPCPTEGCDGVIERDPPFVERVDALPEPMTCGRRGGCWWVEQADGLDRWQRFKAEHHNRVCSFCGSLHFDDLQEIVQKILASDPDDLDFGYEIECTDKSYKIYVRQPGVRNAHEGAIKFYMHHVPRNADGKIAVTEQQNDDYARAVQISKQRWNARFERRVQSGL